ncbi:MULTISPECIES: hypothetical protein [Arsenophonus]|uniref:hypothetical protein n=1 Tax=Arsenophonus TaxID=637 RepID=UPI0015D6E8A2|nr:hypothetical protein [Arsenophonus endosymbiont of Apis mellifera]
MKKVIGIMLIGLLSIFALTGCGDDGKLAGTYQGKNQWLGEHRYLLIINKEGYQLKLQNSKILSKPVEFEAPKEKGFLKKEGNYLIKEDDKTKFFEIIDKSKIKHMNTGVIYTRISNDAN